VTKTRRLFFALWPSPEVRAGIIQRRERMTPPSHRPVPDHNLHLTLVFLGDQPESRLDQILALGDGLALPAFDLLLDRLGWFARARVVWLGGPRVAAGERLIEILTTGLDGLRLKFERRRWAPHVTLFRQVAQRPALPDVPLLDWPITEYSLIESVSGQPYQVLRTWSLQ